MSNLVVIYSAVWSPHLKLRALEGMKLTFIRQEKKKEHKD